MSFRFFPGSDEKHRATALLTLPRFPSLAPGGFHLCAGERSIVFYASASPDVHQAGSSIL